MQAGIAAPISCTLPTSELWESGGGPGEETAELIRHPPKIEHRTAAAAAASKCGLGSESRLWKAGAQQAR